MLLSDKDYWFNYNWWRLCWFC